MKKIIRMSAVFALAGLALLAGCTKDYSADISSLQTKVDTNQKDIEAKLKAEVDELTGKISNLTNSVKKNSDAIDEINKTLGSATSTTGLIKTVGDLQDQLNSEVNKLTQKFANYYTKSETDAAINAAISKIYSDSKIDQLIADAKAACNSYTDLAKQASLKYTDEAVAELELADASIKALINANTAKIAADSAALAGKIQAAKEECEIRSAIILAALGKVDSLAADNIKSVSDSLKRQLSSASLRIAECESNIASNLSQIKNNTASIDNLKSSCDNLSKAIILCLDNAKKYTDQEIASTKAELESDIQRLDARVAAAEELIEQNKSDLQQSIDALKKTDEQLAKDIEALSYKHDNDVAGILEDLKEVRAQLDEMCAALDILVERVQSISFVPEYVADNSSIALGYVFYLGSGNKTPLDGKNSLTVQASYYVNPASKAEEVAESLLNGDSHIVYVETEDLDHKSKAAGALNYATVVSAEFNEETGNVDVVARINARGPLAIPESKSMKTDYSIALQYSVDEEYEYGDEREVFTSSISSDFVKVYAERADIHFGLCRAVNRIGNGYEEYEPQNVEYAWDKASESPEADSYVKWYENYELMAWIGREAEGVSALERFTIEDFADKYGLDEEDITPLQEVTDSVILNGMNPLPIRMLKPADRPFVTATCDKDGRPLVCSNFEKAFTRMIVSENYELTKNNIGVANVSVLVLKFKGGPEVARYRNTYTITKRTIELDLESTINPINVDWTYKLACVLSPEETEEAYLKDTICYKKEDLQKDNTFTHEFTDLAVQFHEQMVIDPAKSTTTKLVAREFTADEKISILDLIANPTNRTTMAKYYDAGSTIWNKDGNFEMFIDDLSIRYARSASVAVAGYDFAKGKARTYAVMNSYANDTDSLVINFGMILGPAPADLNLGEDEKTLDYRFNSSQSKVATNRPCDISSKILSSYEEKGFNYFTSFVEVCQAYKSAFEQNDFKGRSWTFWKNGKAFSSEYTKSYVSYYQNTWKWYMSVGAADISSFADVFTYENVYQTWFGSAVTKTGKITCEDIHNYAKLEFYKTFVDTNVDRLKALAGNRFGPALDQYYGMENVKGIVDLTAGYEHSTSSEPWGEFKVEDSDLSRYFYPTVPNGVANFYSVQYQILNDKNYSVSGNKVYAGLPEFGTGADTIVTFPDKNDGHKVNSANLVWGNYSNRTLLVKARLLYEGQYYSSGVCCDSLILHLEVPKAITVACNSELNPCTVDYKNDTLVLALSQALSIRDSKEEILIKNGKPSYADYNWFKKLLQDAGVKEPSSAKAYDAYFTPCNDLRISSMMAKNVFGVKFTLPSVLNSPDLLARIGDGNNGNFSSLNSYPNLKMIWDKDKAVLSWIPDAAVLQQPVWFKIQFKLNYNYRFYGISDELGASTSVVFKIDNKKN